MMLLKQIFRKILRNKISSIINILGLSFAFSITIVLYLYINNEFSFDSFHQKKDRIVRVVGKGGGGVWTGPMLGKSLKDKFPEVSNFVRTRNNDVCVLSYMGQKHLINNNMAIDSSFFSVFDFNLVLGDKETALIDPFSIVLTEKTANEIFKDKNPIGEILSYNNYWQYTVTGVMKDIPDNSTFLIDVIFPFHAMEFQWKTNKDDIFNVLEQKYNQSFHTYLLLAENTDISILEEKVNKETYQEYRFASKLQKVEDIYFDKNVGERWLKKGNKATVLILLSIAIGIALISLCNFINLNTAMLINSLHSLGVKKTVGAKYVDLIKQYILENTLYLIVTMALGFCIAYIILPFFNNLLSSNVTFYILFGPQKVLVFFTLFVILVFITSLVPVLLIFRKIQAVNTHLKTFTANGNGIRNILVPIQFIFTIIFIVAALSIGKQMMFIKNKSLGFKHDQLLYLLINNERGINTDIFKEEILKLPNVKNLSYSAGFFGDLRRGNFIEINERRSHYNRIYTDAEYIPTLGYEIISGRNFSNDFQSDFSKHAYIINETMAKELEFKNPLQEKIHGHPIVGVVKDFHILPLQSKITPIALVCDPGAAKWVINIKLDKNSNSNTLHKIEEIWNKVSPEFPMLYSFADNRIQSYYTNEMQFSKLSVFFSIISVFLSCIGLVGLVMYTLSHKTREIGIRKVNGAKTNDILALLNTDFIKWIIAAVVIAFPVSWYAMNEWLKGFAYKTQINWWIFAVAGIIVLLFSIITVSLQSWRAANRNPVEALRYE